MNIVHNIVVYMKSHIKLCDDTKITNSTESKYWQSIPNAIQFIRNNPENLVFTTQNDG